MKHEDIDKLRDSLSAIEEAVGWMGDYRAALDELDALREALDIAEDMLRRVVIQGGAQVWTEQEMRDWACDYRDFMNGYRSKQHYERSHEDCGHRARAALSPEPKT